MTALHHDPELVRQLEAARYQALVEGRYDCLSDLFHPELRYTHSSGGVDSREEFLAKCRAGHYDFKRIDHQIDCITFVGDVALVFGEVHADLIAGGIAKVLDSVSLGVWQWDGARWRLLAYQATARARPAPGK